MVRSKSCDGGSMMQNRCLEGAAAHGRWTVWSTAVHLVFQTLGRVTILGCQNLLATLIAPDPVAAPELSYEPNDSPHGASFESVLESSLRDGR